MNSSSHPKVCIIGLDGGTFTVLDKWVQAGEMPHLAALMRRGSRGVLHSTIPPVTGPAWTSMTTGVNPGQHGIYDFFRWDRDCIVPRLARSSDCNVPRLWDIAGQHGLSVGCFRVPVTFPAWPVNGFMVAGLLTPGAVPGMTWPASLLDEIAPLSADWFLPDDDSVKDADEAGRLLQAQKMNDRALRLVLERFRPDFFMCVLAELDPALHHLWPYCTMATDARDPAAGRAVGEFFRSLDDTIGYMVDFFGENAAFFVVSDHGFGPVRRAFRMNNYLAREGFLTVRMGSVHRARALLSISRRLKAVLGRLRLLGVARLVLSRCRGLGLLRAGQRSREFAMLASAVDWRTTLAYARSQSSTGIFLNVRGRTPQGAIEPGDERERALSSLVSALGRAKDPDTGRPLVSALARPEQVHKGPYLGEAPDIFVGLAEGEVAMETVLGGPLFTKCSRPANHRMEGVLVAAGPQIRQGVRLSADILDVAPTALHALGLPVPTYMEGRSLTELFEEDSLVRQPVRFRSAALDESRVQPEAHLSDQYGDEATMRRLRRLGYM